MLKNLLKPLEEDLDKDQHNNVDLVEKLISTSVNIFKYYLMIKIVQLFIYYTICVNSYYHVYFIYNNNSWIDYIVQRILNLPFVSINFNYYNGKIINCSPNKPYTIGWYELALLEQINYWKLQTISTIFNIYFHVYLYYRIYKYEKFSNEKIVSKTKKQKFTSNESLINNKMEPTKYIIEGLTDIPLEDESVD